MFSGRKTAVILLLMNSSGSVSGKVISRVDEILWRYSEFGRWKQYNRKGLNDLLDVDLEGISGCIRKYRTYSGCESDRIFIARKALDMVSFGQRFGVVEKPRFTTFLLLLAASICRILPRFAEWWISFWEARDRFDPQRTAQNAASCGIRGHLVPVIKILFICHGNSD